MVATEPIARQYLEFFTQIKKHPLINTSMIPNSYIHNTHLTQVVFDYVRDDSSQGVFGSNDNSEVLFDNR